jgi:chromosome segregation ATPase
MQGVGRCGVALLETVAAWPPGSPQCHAHLVTDFCPNVNLLTGINGSGKSAVLQALQCCLGARAAETGRYRSMREFVQRGEAQAVVKVTLVRGPRRAPGQAAPCGS